MCFVYLMLSVAITPLYEQPVVSLVQCELPVATAMYSIQCLSRPWRVEERAGGAKFLSRCTISERCTDIIFQFTN